MRNAKFGKLGQALSPREWQILQLLSEGLSEPDLARELYLSLNTIKTHCRRIYTKLGALNRANAVAIGFRQGVLQPMTGDACCEHCFGVRLALAETSHRHLPEKLASVFTGSGIAA